MPTPLSPRHRTAYRLGLLTAWIAALAFGAGCAPRDTRFQQLTELATTEVRELPNPVDRLAKFLQLANLQAWHDETAAARAARDDARQVLMQSDSSKLGMEPRLAGWISLAELSREARSLDDSRIAAGQAETLLHSLEPPHERVQYVQSLAREFEQTRGKEAAIALYTRSAEWAVGMDDLKKRRGAYQAIAGSLVALDEVDAAAEVVRRDDDRGWRADSFIALSRATPYELYQLQQGSLGLATGIPVSITYQAPEGALYSTPTGFSWKRLDFDSYFRSK
jgi:hypothetical protein